MHHGKQITIGFWHQASLLKGARSRPSFPLLLLRFLLCQLTFNLKLAFCGSFSSFKKNASACRSLANANLEQKSFKNRVQAKRQCLHFISNYSQSPLFLLAFQHFQMNDYTVKANTSNSSSFLLSQSIRPLTLSAGLDFHSSFTIVKLFDLHHDR
jgi:hypothetical protein